MLIAAAEAHIDACPMEGFDNAKVDEVLGLAALGLKSVVLCPVGFHSDADTMASLAKVRFPKEEIVVELK